MVCYKLSKEIWEVVTFCNQTSNISVDSQMKSYVIPPYLWPNFFLKLSILIGWRGHLETVFIIYHTKSILLCIWRIWHLLNSVKSQSWKYLSLTKFVTQIIWLVRILFNHVSRSEHYHLANISSSWYNLSIYCFFSSFILFPC